MDTDELTALRGDHEFFSLAQGRIGEFRNGWCMIGIDIRHYKLFVDWYGVDSGQYLLNRSAEVLRHAEEAAHGIAGHMGQDQFCIILPYDEEKLKALQTELQELISSISPIKGFTPYFGIAMIDDSSDSIREFYNRAALTVDEIENNVDTTIRVYDAAIHRKNADEYEMLFEFQHAIERGEITFFLQPQYRVSNRKVVGAESLARWQRPDGTQISPAVFVPVLEKYGQIGRLDSFIWESVCRWCRSWLDRGHRLVPISINVSRQDFAMMDVPAFLGELLKKYDLKPDDIQIEITETAYADDLNPVQETVQNLRQKGFSVLMDDFGNGYSSLSMLRNLNMDVIKLDAQFLRLDREVETKGVSILESIINMTRNISTPIIVEGVETEDQARFLARLGCMYMQGYLFSRPMPVGEFEALIGKASRVDEQGFVFKSNQQMRVREFFDENIYSDAILNNILGPIAFYNLVGQDVDIVRYNEQFFELTGLTEQQMEERIHHIQEYMPEEDREKLLQILADAVEHLTLGGHGVVRAMKSNGVYIWLELQVFFLEEDHRGKRFYVSARDVTETYYVSVDMPGAYYRTTLNDDFEFLFISETFLEMTGYTRDEIRLEFDNRMENMTHPDDRDEVQAWSHEIIDGKSTETRPYRIRHKRKGYIYIAEKDRVTDRFGQPCYQSIAIDVTDVMVMRNQMRILSDHLTDTIVFVRPNQGRFEFEVVTYNLESVLERINAKEFENLINGGIFFEWIGGYEEVTAREHMTRDEFIRWHLDEIVKKSSGVTVRLPFGEAVNLFVRADRVRDRKTRVEYIVMLRPGRADDQHSMPRRERTPC